MKYQVSPIHMPLHFSVRRLVGFFFRSLFWSLNVGLVLYTLLLYWLLADVPIQHWSASMLMITLPIAWGLNLACLLMWLFANPWRSMLSLLTLLAGFWLWPRTLALNTPVDSSSTHPLLTLLSYNVMGFDSEDYYATPPKQKRTLALTNWVIQQEAAVKCFQEFYNSKRHPALRMVDRLRAAGYTYQALMLPDSQQTNDAFIGVAIFSRYPILNQGSEPFGLRSHNGIVWADIKLGSDTVRLINVHLESMGIRVRNVLNEQEMAGVRRQTRGILGSLREGFIDRQSQLRTVEQHIADSPFPVIVTGDFNETPYSVVYGRLHQKLNNAFEDAGQGFGFSLNRAPNLLRIDNQFYDARKLTATRFETLRNVPYSDHFPIFGSYVMNDDRAGGQGMDDK